MARKRTESGKRKAALRADAETRLARAPSSVASGRRTDELLHELRVHQIELEMQNEELRHAQNALEESRERYVDLYEFAPVGYLTLTSDGLILEANLTAAALLERDRSKLRRRRFSLLVAPEDRDRFHILFRGTLQSEGLHTDELAFQRSDGSVLHAQVGCLRAAVGDSALSARNRANAGGAAGLGVRITLTDISERKQASEAAMKTLLAMSDSIEAKVRKRTLQLRTLSVMLALSEERVRREVAQDLHDDLGQVLAAVKHKLTVLLRNTGTGTAERPLREIEVLIDQANHSVRALAAQLHPPALYSLGLIPALDQLAEEMKLSFGLAVQIHDNGTTANLTEPALSTTYRALRELLVNVAKHARVSAAAIDCRTSSTHLILTVSDCGIGFDYDRLYSADSNKSGFGLLGMRARIEYLGGEMQVGVTAGKGTRVTLRMPLRTPPEVTAKTG